MQQGWALMVTVAAVFHVPRAYFYAKEKRNTFVQASCVPTEMRASHVGKLREALYGTWLAAASWSDELRKACQLWACRGSCVAVLLS